MDSSRRPWGRSLCWPRGGEIDRTRTGGRDWQVSEDRINELAMEDKFLP